MNKKSYLTQAMAAISGSEAYSEVSGTVWFKQMQNGVIITAQIFGLPIDKDSCINSGFFGFHIHSGAACAGNKTDPFSETGGHFNPKNCPHPFHAGDLPPLMGNNGYAYMSVFTNRFSIKDILGRTVVIHKDPDDFVTQPSGNSGEKIACGKIMMLGEHA